MPIKRVIGLPQSRKKRQTYTFIIAFNLKSEFFLDITFNDFMKSV